MKVGLCVTDISPLVGGGYVLSEDVARAALSVKGRHQFALLKANLIYPSPPESFNSVIRTKVSGRTLRNRLALNDAPPFIDSKPSNKFKRVVRSLVRSIATPQYFVETMIDQKLATTKRQMEAAMIDHAEAMTDLTDLIDHTVRQTEAMIYDKLDPGSFGVFETDVRSGQVDMLWFNNIKPIDIGLPYMLNIFDLQHRLQPWFPEVSANRQWKIREALYADATRRASIVTVGSQEAKEQVGFFYGVPPDRIHVIPFPTPQAALEAGADREGLAVSEQLLRKYGIKGEYLYYPAQFWPHKNHVNLLRALHVLREQHKLEFSLVLTGSDEGNNLSHVQRTASELGLASYVHVLGFIPREDVIALYRSAFALTFVSFFGPENLPPLEALALGCPIVLANIPGVRALFGEGPVLVDPRDPNAIAAGVKQLYDNPNLRLEYAEAGRDLARINSSERYIRTIHELLDEFEPIRRCWPVAHSG